ncbi:MAG: hypothetical protein ABIP29_02455 [Candidatus Eisenbacteria bacterium]
MRLNSVRLATFAIVGSLLVAGPAAALDVPRVVPMQSKPGSVRLMVNAGNSGAPLGFYIERIKKSEYDALGGWPASPSGSWMGGSFTGVPSFNIEGTADAYALAPAEAIEVELGQLFDETGVVATDLDELEPGTQYMIRVKANGSGPWTPSGFSESIVVSSTPLAQNCTFTQGYWKNHEEVWPVTGLTLGNVSYSAAQLLQILQQQPQGNKLVILAHQLIAAKLNLANGASPASVATTIANADAIIANKVVPPIGSGSLTNNPATSYANTLDDFNNGLLGPGHCGSVPANASTWGSVKAMYRE